MVLPRTVMWGKEHATSLEMLQVYSQGTGVSVLRESPARDTQAGGRDGYMDLRPRGVKTTAGFFLFLGIQT